MWLTFKFCTVKHQNLLPMLINLKSIKTALDQCLSDKLYRLSGHQISHCAQNYNMYFTNCQKLKLII